MSLKSYPIYSTISKLDSGKFLTSYFWRTKDHNLFDNSGNTYFFTSTATTADELNGEVSRQFYAEYLRGTFDLCLDKLGYDEKSCMLNLKTNNFVMPRDIVSTQPSTIDIELGFDPLEMIF